MDSSLCTSLRSSRFIPDQYAGSTGRRITLCRLASVAKAPTVLIAGLLLLLGVQPEASGQEVRYALSQQTDYSQTYSTGDQVRGPVQPLSAAQLEQLVAPFALYPDALVAQILAGSTYPQQIAEADGWRQQLGNAPAEQVVAEADAQPWDPSVKALTAFPRVLAQMDRNLQWTTDLGNAYYNQPEDVLEAVQVMRGRARDAGNLRSTPQQMVSYNEGYIQLAPPNPQVVYVPAYDPWTVYGEPMSPYPGYTLLGVLGDIFGGAPLRYGMGIAMSAFTSAPWGWLAWGLNWLGHELLFDNSDYYSHSNSVADWGFRNTGFHAYGGHGGFGRSGFGHSGMRGEGWRHEGYAGGSWHSFGRGNSFAGNRGGEWRSFGRNNAGRGNWGARNWRSGSGGFQSFRGVHSRSGEYGRGFGNGHAQYAANFNHGWGGNVRQSRFSNRSSRRSSGSQLGSYGGSYRGSVGGTRHSGGSHWFGGGRSQRNFGGRSWGGGHSGGGGHASKGFGGGRSFGGGHSGGGHSGGHGGGSRHRR